MMIHRKTNCVQRIEFLQTKLHALSEGDGFSLVLLHGYLESMNIWDDFAARLKQHFRVIRMDLPGHGESGPVAPAHSMEIMAESVKTVLDALSVNKCLLVGHSMGGYVTLAVAEAMMEKLYGFCLFHSTPFADNDEKKANRDREIELVQKGKKELIINSNIPKGFADDNLLKFQTHVAKAISIALKTPDDGIIAALRGMKSRCDRSSVIQNSPVPVLWILGEKDNYINYQAVREKIALNRMGRLLILKNSGHMGFIEEHENTFSHLLSFCKECMDKQRKKNQ
ncbi:MAG: alpha/beta hydrolase [Bacteroidales bacterium]|nr:alpha/beta hydrolase [Bacteroidales bacterium]